MTWQGKWITINQILTWTAFAILAMFNIKNAKFWPKLHYYRGCLLTSNQPPNAESPQFRWDSFTFIVRVSYCDKKALWLLQHLQGKPLKPGSSASSFSTSNELFYKGFCAMLFTCLSSFFKFMPNFQVTTPGGNGASQPPRTQWQTRCRTVDWWLLKTFSGAWFDLRCSSSRFHFRKIP